MPTPKQTTPPEDLRAVIEAGNAAFDRRAFAEVARRLREELAPLQVDSTTLLREDRDR